MLENLEQLFLKDPNTVIALAMAAVSIIGLLAFYLLAKTKNKIKESDAYEEFLAEEFNTVLKKETEILQLPPEPLPDLIFDEPAVKKPARKKAAKKTVKKAAKKKAVKVKEEKK